LYGLEPHQFELVRPMHLKPLKASAVKRIDEVEGMRGVAMPSSWEGDREGCTMRIRMRQVYFRIRNRKK
jgi:hypothetical protein